MYKLLIILFLPFTLTAQNIRINNNAEKKVVVFGNGKMLLTVHYGSVAGVSNLQLNGEEVLDTSGIFSLISSPTKTYSSKQLLSNPVYSSSANGVTISNIVYGDSKITFNETWNFLITQKDIQFKLTRTTSAPISGTVVSSPVIIFKDINTWEGSYQDYGGFAWFYLFNKPLDTYGVHSTASDFWNSKTNAGLTIAVKSATGATAMSYTRTKDDKLEYRIANASAELQQRNDTPTFRRRFIRNSTDVWAGSTLKAGVTSQTITFTDFDFNAKYGRGEIKGLDGKQVGDVLNTIARIGVIDKQHFGGNSWHTPYGPICLHEQYIGQMGIGINDPSYLKGYQQCLDFYRDHAIKPDGRVWSRWAYTNEDMMPGQVNKQGFYEAQWGFLIDANPDLVINVAELYDQTGNKAWLQTHKVSCEKALDWLLKRDFNNNGLVEMLNDNSGEQKSSDWIDIIWASYENAFVNAKLYRALTLWAAAEARLGDAVKAKYYAEFAARLKASFNKSTKDGGLWDEENQCYIHWRDKDGSIHGRNMVTPVNFMAISYGICDDADRSKTILDNIETQMVKENLFFWPLCLTTYAAGEGKEWQFPFPNYENGDIFLSWGSVAVDAYARYRPELAVKYIRKVLEQYAKDGLAFQRYGRAKQDGLGDDILSGNGLSIVGLYRSVFGINPMFNRLYLDPHITPELAGTKLRYRFRGAELQIGLNEGSYTIGNEKFEIAYHKNFGFSSIGNQAVFYEGDQSTPTLTVFANKVKQLRLKIESISTSGLIVNQDAETISAQKVMYTFHSSEKGKSYDLIADGKVLKAIKPTAAGLLTFDVPANSKLIKLALK